MSYFGNQYKLLRVYELVKMSPVSVSSNKKKISLVIVHIYTGVLKSPWGGGLFYGGGGGKLHFCAHCVRSAQSQSPKVVSDSCQLPS